MICTRCFKAAREATAKGWVTVTREPHALWWKERQIGKRLPAGADERVEYELCPECARAVEDVVYGRIL